MAATNFTPIQLYHSTTATAAPTAANLAQGELAINITDGKLYYEDNGGVVQVLATKGTGSIGGTTTQIQFNNSGALAGNAAMTFNSGTSTTTLTTLNLTNALGATHGGTSQSAYTLGDILYSSATNTLAKLSIGTVNFILTSTGSIPQWVAPSSVTVQTANNLAGGAAGSVPYQSGAATTIFLAIGAANRVMTSTGTAPQWVTSLTGLTGVSSSSITNTSLTSGRVVVSTTAGLQADDADLTFDGTTLSAGGLSTVGLSTLVKTVTVGNSNFNGAAVFAPSTPAKLLLGTGIVTDVTSAISATNTIGAVAALAITPIAATNTGVTYTNAATLYISGAPSASTNVTITNPYALYIDAGNVYLGGGTANGVAFLNASKVLTTGSALTFNATSLGVGIGAAASEGQLHLNNASGADLVLTRTNGATSGLLGRIRFGNTDVDSAMSEISSEQSGATNASNLIFSTQASGGATTEQMRLTSTGLKSAIAGTNADPVFSNTADTNTGIFFPAADKLGFTAGGGTDQMVLTSTGLGIGTSLPGEKLVVVGGVSRFSRADITPSGTANTIANDAVFGSTDTANTGITIFGSNELGVYFGSAAANAVGQMRYQLATNKFEWTVNSGASIQMSLSSDGTFRVKGAGSAGTTDAFQVAGGAPADAVSINSTGDIRLQGSAPGKLLFFSTGNGVSQNATLEVQNDGATTNTGEFKFSTRNAGNTLAERARISSDGTFRVKGAGSAGTTDAFQVAGGAPADAARITSGGDLMVGKTVLDSTTNGCILRGNGEGIFTASALEPVTINRNTDDGTLVSLRQSNIVEGSISVSGTTVSYNGGHLSRWAQTTTSKDDTLVKGTVLSNLDEMNVYTDVDGNPVENEQLNKVKVSDVEGDANVAGVFVNWTHDDAHNVDEINMAMTGDMIIRIAQGTTVQRGDLLMSAGNGTAKPQGDDIVRSKTVAKVTSTHVTCTYADGSYCVPCVLMAC